MKCGNNSDYNNQLKTAQKSLHDLLGKDHVKIFLQFIGYYARITYDFAIDKKQNLYYN